MGADRVVSIVRCEIREGRAYLSAGDRHLRNCHGSCSLCMSFMGVDIRQVGQPYLDGDCLESPYLHMQDTEMPAGSSRLH